MTWLSWIGTAAVWATFAYQIRQIIRIRRRAKGERALMLAEIAHEEELTPLQIEVAMDAAAATFMQRITEMRRANRAHG